LSSIRYGVVLLLASALSMTSMTGAKTQFSETQWVTPANSELAIYTPVGYSEPSSSSSSSSSSAAGQVLLRAGQVAIALTSAAWAGFVGAVGAAAANWIMQQTAMSPTPGGGGPVPLAKSRAAAFDR
jgi:hypothetical protein